MLIKLTKLSRLNGVTIPIGEKVEIDDKLASIWIQKGRAKRVNEEGKDTAKPKKSKQVKREKPVETAVNKPGEQAISQKGSSRRSGSQEE